MKKTRLLFAMGMMCVLAHATPADPTPARVTQPDGTTITLILHGDEFLNYLTTSDGYTVVKNEAGYYTYARLDGDRLVASDCIARDSRTAADQMYLASMPKGLRSPSMVERGTRMLKHRNDLL